MSDVLARLRRNPVLVTGLVTAVLGLLVAFGLDLTKEQTASIMALVGSLLAIFARSKVTPVKRYKPKHKA